MNVTVKIILTILVFLAVSSGVTKILLMEQEVEFFGRHGFANAMIIAFGATQLLGGVLIVFRKSRLLGAILVEITFAISAVLLFMDRKIPILLVTVVAMLALALVTRWTEPRKT